MPKPKQPKTDPEELNDMISDAAEELGWSSYNVKPGLVGGDKDHGGSMPKDVENYHKALKVRQRTSAWLRKHPEWIAEWRAERELDRRIELLCEVKGLTFAPWECPPWQVRVDDQLPGATEWTSIWDESAYFAQRLRRELQAELAAEDARKSAEKLG